MAEPAPLVTHVYFLADRSASMASIADTFEPRGATPRFGALGRLLGRAEVGWSGRGHGDRNEADREHDGWRGRLPSPVACRRRNRSSLIRSTVTLGGKGKCALTERFFESFEPDE